MTASLLTSLGVGLYSASLGNGDVARAEQTINNNPIADESSNRSITIWKYQVKDVSEIGDRGDGKEKDVDKEPLSGINFKIQKVTKKAGGASLKDPLKQKEGTDYDIDESFAAQTLPTGEEGDAKFNLGVGTDYDGIYLVTELADDRVSKPADPFFVYVPQTDRQDHGSLIYDVEVQPKNILNSLLEPDKTVEEGRGYSVKAGEEFSWEAQANVPEGLYQVATKDGVISPTYTGEKDENDEWIKGPDKSVTKDEEIYANHFTMTDTLVEELKINNVKVQVKTDESNWTDLVLGTDYKITIDGDEKTSSTNTDAEKLVVMSLEQAGMKKVSQGDFTKIRTVYTTETDKDFNGVLSNHFEVKYLSPGLKPITTENPKEKDPEYFTGGFDIEKTAEDKTAPDNKLAGAEFMLAESKENAEKEIFIASDGKSYHKNDTLPTPEGKDPVVFLKSTTDGQGHASFNGLALNWYDDANKNGKQDIDDEPTFEHKDIKKDYWVVETKAPQGYELLKKPEQITVTLTTKDDAIELDVVNKPETDLPFTGGEGTMLLVAIAIGAITIGTATIMIEKKRRQA
ncbi:hypothetical protein IGI53_002797 [Enterococcus sp. DIV0788_1]